MNISLLLFCCVQFWAIEEVQTLIKPCLSLNLKASITHESCCFFLPCKSPRKPCCYINQFVFYITLLFIWWLKILPLFSDYFFWGEEAALLSPLFLFGCHERSLLQSSRKKKNFFLVSNPLSTVLIMTKQKHINISSTRGQTWAQRSKREREERRERWATGRKREVKKWNSTWADREVA